MAASTSSSSSKSDDEQSLVSVSTKESQLEKNAEQGGSTKCIPHLLTVDGGAKENHRGRPTGKKIMTLFRYTVCESSDSITCKDSKQYIFIHKIGM